MQASLESQSRVWLIEADPELALILRTLFEDEGFAVSGCATLAEVAAELAAGKTGVLVLDVSRSTLGDCRGLHQELLPVMSHTVPILLLRNHKGWLPAGADLRLVQVLADNCLDIEQIILNVRHLLPLSTRSVA